MDELTKYLNQEITTLKLLGADTALRQSTNTSTKTSVETPSIKENSKQALLKLNTEVIQCVKCKELAVTRTQTVFGSGNINAELLFVGEAPGFEEDKQGLPFVGAAGQLLTKIIEAIGMKRENVYICNVLKCRPPGNRNPLPDEVANCEPFLIKQLAIIKPKMIVALGKFAAQSLLKTEAPISKLRGRFSEYQSVPLMCTYHPAYLLRNPGDKKLVWEDMKMVRDKLKTL